MFSCCCRKDKVILENDFQDNTLILQAIREDDLEMVKSLWTQGLNFNKEIYKSKNCLQIAIEIGSLPVIQFMVSHNADLNKRSLKSGQTILHLAASRGDEAIFRFLFFITNVELHFETDFEGKNIAHVAAFAGNYEIIKRINEKEKKLAHLLDIEGENSMHKAVKANSISIIKYLHENCGISMKSQNYEGQTPESLTNDQQIRDYCAYWALKENNGADYFISSSKNKIVGRDTT